MIPDGETKTVLFEVLREPSFSTVLPPIDLHRSMSAAVATPVAGILALTKLFHLAMTSIKRDPAAATTRTATQASSRLAFAVCRFELRTAHFASFDRTRLLTACFVFVLLFIAALGCSIFPNVS